MGRTLPKPRPIRLRFGGATASVAAGSRSTTRSVTTKVPSPAAAAVSRIPGAVTPGRPLGAAREGLADGVGLAVGVSVRVLAATDGEGAGCVVSVADGAAMAVGVMPGDIR